MSNTNVNPYSTALSSHDEEQPGIAYNELWWFYTGVGFSAGLFAGLAIVVNAPTWAATIAKCF